jgi:hypothetical protein
MKTNIVLLIMLAIVIEVINCLMILEEDKGVKTSSISKTKSPNPQIFG